MTHAPSSRVPILGDAPPPMVSGAIPATPCRLGEVGALRVLVVDDTAVNRLVLQRMLLSQGVEPTMTTDGGEAVEAAAACRFDLVLMDVSMRRMDGLEATRRIRERARGKVPVPIVAVTANAGVAQQERCAEAGMDGLMTKPLRGDNLASMLGAIRAGHPSRPDWARSTTYHGAGGNGRAR